MNCLCGSGQLYDACCQPLHNGVAAQTALALMRSRYVAYALNLHDYLSLTWHDSTRPDGVMTEQGLKWLGLTIQRVWHVAADEAFVEFVARYRIYGGRAQRLHEVSRFVRESECWFYVDGVFPDECQN